MDISQNTDRISFKNVIMTWWLFFWRYALLLVLLLVVNGLVINKLGKTMSLPFLALSNFCINILVSLAVFLSILGKRIRKTDFVVIPASTKRKNPVDSQKHITVLAKTLTWWSYFWRFVIIIFPLGALIGWSRLRISEHIELPKYFKYADNLAVIPATLLVFILLMWRRQKRRKLDLLSMPAVSSSAKE